VAINHKGRGIAGKAEAKIGEQEQGHDEALRERHNHEGNDFPQQEFMRGNA
jgi:hypothetical protein